jgi:hypothetical protein
LKKSFRWGRDPIERSPRGREPLARPPRQRVGPDCPEAAFTKRSALSLGSTPDSI